MGLVFCPECNKKVSQYAEICPDCGFPIKKIMDDNNITDVTKAFICPKIWHLKLQLREDL